MTIHRILHRAVLSLGLSFALLLGAGAAQAAPHAVDGRIVTLDLGHTLDQRKLLDPADFTVTASGTAVAVLSASFAENGKGVDLGLARAGGRCGGRRALRLAVVERGAVDRIGQPDRQLLAERAGAGNPSADGGVPRPAGGA